MIDLYFILTAISLGAIICAAICLAAAFFTEYVSAVKGIRAALFLSCIALAAIAGAAVSHRIIGHGAASDVQMNLITFFNEHRVVPLLFLLSVVSIVLTAKFRISNKS